MSSDIDVSPGYDLEVLIRREHDETELYPANLMLYLVLTLNAGHLVQPGLPGR